MPVGRCLFPLIMAAAAAAAVAVIVQLSTLQVALVRQTSEDFSIGLLTTSATQSSGELWLLRRVLSWSQSGKARQPRQMSRTWA